MRYSTEKQKERIAAKKAEIEAKKNPQKEKTIIADEKKSSGKTIDEPIEEKTANQKKAEPKIKPDINVNNNVVDPFLESPTAAKDYAKDNVNVIGSIPSSVPEEIIESPTIDMNSRDPEPEIQKEPIFHPEEVRNPAWDEMTKKQQNLGSQYITENLINGYVALNGLAKDYVSFDYNKYQKKAIKGEFDMNALNVELQISSDGKTIPIGQLLEDVNEMAERAFTVSDKFKSEVRPLLNSICKDKGWGMSPTQQLVYIVGKDALPKVINIFQIKNTLNAFLDVSQEILTRMKEQQPVHQQPGTIITNVQPEQGNGEEKQAETTKKDQEPVNNNSENIKDDSTINDPMDMTNDLEREKKAAEAAGKKKNVGKSAKNKTEVIAEQTEPGEK